MWMELENGRRKSMEKKMAKIQKVIDKLEKQKDGAFVSESKKAKLQNSIDEKVFEQNLIERSITDESAQKELYDFYVNNSVFTKIGNNLDKTGDALQSTGNSMVKAGAHTTAAVWTPALYVGYRGVKHLRNKPKNESVEQDLIELINEVEKAHKDGKITEAQKKDYVLDFVDNYYR